MKKEDVDGEIPFAFAVPPVACYVVCLHVMTGKNGKATGMKIVEVGKGNGGEKNDLLSG